MKNKIIFIWILFLILLGVFLEIKIKIFKNKLEPNFLSFRFSKAKKRNDFFVDIVDILKVWTIILILFEVYYASKYIYKKFLIKNIDEGFLYFLPMKNDVFLYYTDNDPDNEQFFNYLYQTEIKHILKMSEIKKNRNEKLEWDCLKNFLQDAQIRETLKKIFFFIAYQLRKITGKLLLFMKPILEKALVEYRTRQEYFYSDFSLLYYLVLHYESGRKYYCLPKETQTFFDINFFVRILNEPSFKGSVNLDYCFYFLQHDVAENVHAMNFAKKNYLAILRAMFIDRADYQSIYFKRETLLFILTKMYDFFRRLTFEVQNLFKKYQLENWGNYQCLVKDIYDSSQKQIAKILSPQ